MMNLLTFKFWFDSRPDDLTEMSRMTLFVLTGLLAACGIVLRVIAKKNPSLKSVFKSLASFCFVNGFISLVFIFMAYELVPILSSRFWFIIWWLSMALWLFLIFRSYKKIQGLRVNSEKDQEIKRYIP